MTAPTITEDNGILRAYLPDPGPWGGSRQVGYALANGNGGWFVRTGRTGRALVPNRHEALQLLNAAGES